eukprot:3459597-Amphidinium_carterae.1
MFCRSSPNALLLGCHLSKSSAFRPLSLLLPSLIELDKLCASIDLATIRLDTLSEFAGTTDKSIGCIVALQPSLAERSMSV